MNTKFNTLNKPECSPLPVRLGSDRCCSPLTVWPLPDCVTQAGSRPGL